MISFNHLFLLVAVFGVMLAAVNILPPILQDWRDRRKQQAGRTEGAAPSPRFSLQRLNTLPRIIGALVIGGILSAVTQNIAPVLIFLALAVAGPKVWETFQRERRIQQFDNQLLDGLVLVNNALKSGLDIVTGIELIATNMKPPISEEFGQTLNAYRLGAPLEEALRNMTLRIRSRSLETAVSSIVIQRETGGNLIKTFEQLILTIREESKLQKKIQAISSQGRTQVTVLAFFPWVIGAVFFTISPDTMRAALSTTTGQLVLVGLVLWEGIGLMVTKKIVTVDV